MNNNNKIKIYIFICFLITSLFTEDRNFVIRDYMENGNIDALIKNVEDEIYLVQLDIKNDSLLNLALSVLPQLELYAGPSSYHRLLNKNHIKKLKDNLSEDYIQVLDEYYSTDDSRDYWSLTLQGNQYYSSGGETDDSCMCINSSDCVVVGYNDSWYNPFDYSGDVTWNFTPPYFDEVTEARVFLTGAQCDDFPLSSETTLSLKNNSCGVGDFQVTLSESYTTNGPYVLTGDILDNIWCDGGLQALVQSEDNYNVDWIRIELYYSCDVSNTPNQFIASDESSCDYVQMNWDYVYDADNYLLYKDDQLIANINSDETQYIDYDVEEGNEYVYCIKSQNICGESEASCNYGSIKPNAEQTESIQASNQFPDYIQIVWDSVEDVTFYNLYRDNFLLNVIPENSDLLYIDQFVDQNIDYEYCVEANNECGPSSLICDIGQLAITDLGDINIDGTIDVLDIVLVVNFILELQIFDDTQQFLSDLNSDGLINILDIVLLANLILSTN